MGWYELDEYGQVDYRESEYEPDDIRYWDDIAMQQHEEDMKRIGGQMPYSPNVYRALSDKRFHRHIPNNINTAKSKNINDF
jgi:hypothetical protein